MAAKSGNITFLKLWQIASKFQRQIRDFRWWRISHLFPEGHRNPVLQRPTPPKSSLRYVSSRQNRICLTQYRTRLRWFPTVRASKHQLCRFITVIIIIKGVARLQFKRRQSGQVKRRRRVSRGAQSAERCRVWEGVDPLPRIFYYLTWKWSILVLYKLELTEYKQGRNCKRRLASYWPRLWSSSSSSSSKLQTNHYILVETLAYNYRLLEQFEFLASTA